MKRIMLVLILASALTAFAVPASYANNIAVSKVTLEGQSAANDTYDIKFDISWDNSWRNAGAPTFDANWDAAWVFAKYCVWSGSSWSDWAHCNLLNTGSTAPSGSVITFADTGGVYKGAFIYRSSAGSGSNNWTDAKIKWDYSTGEIPVSDDSRVKVRLFAVEMAYVPQGSFYVGDTNASGPSSPFYEGATTHEFLVTSEVEIQVTNEAGSLYYAYDTYAGDQAGPIPAAFPKGFSAFYIMKHELSQKQYCDFLNTITSTQQTNRYVTWTTTLNSNRYYIKKASSTPAYFGCDASGNAGTATAADKYKLNEANDGQWTACNYLSWADVAAYADWAALRPFTELEYEKACRGCQMAVDNEYAWGNSSVSTATTSLLYTNTSTEEPNQGNVNYSSCSPDGPYRCGSFAKTSGTRTTSGAGYCGALELSGSLYERAVTVGNSTGRGFTGSHGDGKLNADGTFTNSDWPVSSSAVGSSRRGGWWNGSTANYVSDRSTAAQSSTARDYSNGGRFARTAP